MKTTPLTFAVLLMSFGTIAFSAVAADDEESPCLPWIVLLHDRTATADVHKQAEAELMRCTDPQALIVLLRYFDEDAPWVSWAVRQARYRVWEHLATEAEPEEARKEIYAELFDLATNDLQLQALTWHASANWTTDVRDQLRKVYRDRQRDDWTRYYAAGALRNMHYQTPREEFREISDELIDIAWAERGSSFSLLMGPRVAYRLDPRGGALLLDSYAGGGPEVGQGAGGHVLTVAKYFKIEGVRPLMDYTDEQRAVSDARSRAMNENDIPRAMELGDQMREWFDQRRAENARIVAEWVEKNRAQVERKAQEFAEQRQREREQQRE